MYEYDEYATEPGWSTGDVFRFPGVNSAPLREHCCLSYTGYTHPLSKNTGNTIGVRMSNGVRLRTSAATGTGY